MQSNTRNLLIILAGVLILLCCCCAVIGGVGAYFFLAPTSSEVGGEAPAIVVTRLATATPSERLPKSTPTDAAAPGAQPAVTPAAEAMADDAEADALMANEMPAADALDLARRLQTGMDDIPTVVNAEAPSYKVGDTQKFWVANSDTLEHHQVTAVLRYMTAHVAMWVEEGVKFNQRDLEASAKRFEEKTYPTNREFFGSEWSPGVDNDVRLHILHARGLGETVAGYYSSADEYSRKINEYSNEREMFYISADSGNAKPNSDFYDGTLAHEFQHMIHWANDRNEASWVNEGMSELASYLNGFDAGGADMAYSEKPDTQLTTWAEQSDSNIEHYGASYLFTAYFLDRFGESLTQAVVASPKNGIPGYNDALQAAGRPERFDDIFADWVIANYLDAPTATDDGRFGYSDLDPDNMAVAETFRSYPAATEAEVNQYGADYIKLRGDGMLNIAFEGQQAVGLVDATPQGAYSWWSNRGDQSNSTLTRAFDLRSVKSATLTFSTWYDIEDGWDYAYVEVSTDGGKQWQILNARYTTDEDTSGNGFGAGWTGNSGRTETSEWVDEAVDLTPFAGQEILVRFEYVTDDAVNRPGMLLDNIAIPELGYRDDAENGAGGWEAAGWALTDNVLRQRWLVQLVTTSNRQITVERMVIGADGRGQITVPDMGNLQDAVLVISALTPVTTEPASYTLDVTQQ